MPHISAWTLAELELPGGRPAVARRYAIDKKVLDSLGDPTANKGGKDGARKVGWRRRRVHDRRGNLAQSG